jgi:hypothetical protein
VEQFFAQFLGSQRNMENMQQNMKAALRHIVDNTHHGLNPGGHEANQYSSFKDFVDTRPLTSMKRQSHWMLKNG